MQNPISFLRNCEVSLRLPFTHWGILVLSRKGPLP